MQVSPALRDLIRMTRKETAHMSQRTAAKAAGYSTVWWRHIEEGRYDELPSDTLARMCYVIGVSPESLRELGFSELAEAIEARRRFLGGDNDTPYKDAAEAHLWRSPLDARMKRELIAHLRLLRKTGGDPAAAAVLRDLRKR